MNKKREINLCTKIINGIKFTSHKYENGKYLITAEGYVGERWYSYETWEKRNNNDITDKRSSFNPNNKRWFKKTFHKINNIPHITNLYKIPLLLNAPKSELEVVSELCWKFINKIVENEWKQTKKEFFNEKDIRDVMFYSYVALENFDDMIGIKELYRKLCKLYHPDNGIYASEKMIKKINNLFE